MRYCKSYSYLVPFLLLSILLACTTGRDNKAISNYHRNRNLFEKVCAFKSDVEFSFETPIRTKDLFTIDQSKEEVRVIKRSNDGFFTTIKITEKGISVKLPDGSLKETEDTEANRMALGIPPMLGINPYYPLISTIATPNIKVVSKGQVEVSFEGAGVKLKEDIFFKDGAVIAIDIYSGKSIVQRLKYFDFIELSNGTLFPTKYVHTVYNESGDILRDLTVSYRTPEIKLCS